jgi:N-methylhydantoinase B
MCQARIRVPEQWHGDFLAMIGAALSGERDLLALGAEVGWDTLAAFTRQWIDYGEVRMDMAIRALTPGKAHGRSRHDPMPGTPAEGVEVRATVHIDGDRGHIHVDLTDNIDVLPCGLNVSESCARTAAMIGIFNAIDAEVPKNAGSFRRIDVALRPGSVLGGGAHPVSFSVSTTNIADRIVAAVQLAVGSICAEAAVAEVGAVNPPHKGVVSGVDPHSGRPFINQLFLGSTGGPASAHSDAWLTYSHAGNGGICFVDSIEMAEMHHPIRVLSRALVPDSEGAGEYIGAPCLAVELGPRTSEMRIAYVSDGVVNPAQGVAGGGPGGLATQALRRADGMIEALAPFGTLLLRPGETVLSRGTGGGGCGNPVGRDRGLIAATIADGLLSRERAARIYAFSGAAPDLQESNHP